MRDKIRDLVIEAIVNTDKLTEVIEKLYILVDNNKMKTTEDLTEYSIKFLGFKLIKEYEHNHFFTNRYKKGRLEVEFTYDDKNLISIDVKVNEIIGSTINKTELQALDNILNKAQK